MHIRETKADAVFPAKPDEPRATATDAVPNPSGRPKLFITFAVLLVVCFIVPLCSLVTYAAGTDLHSHILLIPFISGYLFYLRRAELPRQFSSSPAAGLAFAILGLAAVSLAMVFQHSAQPLSQNDQLALSAFGFVSLL